MDYSLSGAEDPHFTKELAYGGLWTYFLYIKLFFWEMCLYLPSADVLADVQRCASHRFHMQ